MKEKEHLKKYRLTAFVGHSFCDMNLVGQYKNAIDILIDKINEKKSRVDIIAHPLLYLMKHSIELGLKENIKYLAKYSNIRMKNLKTHSLDDLYDELIKHLNKITKDMNFDDDMINETNKYIKDLDYVIKELGKNWSAFRYIYDNKGEKVFENQKTINVYELKNKYDNAIFFLVFLINAISQYTDFFDFVKFDNSIKEKSLGKVLFTFNVDQKDWLIQKMNKMFKNIIEKEVWFDAKNNYFLHLKEANGKCYIIPMVKI